MRAILDGFLAALVVTTACIAGGAAIHVLLG